MDELSNVIRELPKVIWEGEHKGGTRYRIVKLHDAKGSVHQQHKLEMSAPGDVDAMGVRTWSEGDQCKQVVVEVLLAALLRELPS